MNYLDNLLKLIDEWNKPAIDDEWLFANFRDLVESKMSEIEAFEAINDTVDVLLEQADESTVIEVLETLILLARHSKTTELPSNLSEKKMQLVYFFSNYGEYAKTKLQELFSYYRLGRCW